LLIGLSDEPLNCLNVVITRESLLKFQQFGRDWREGIVDESVFLNRPMWYPYLGFLEGLFHQLVLVARKTPDGEPFLLIANTTS
jgi:hypothetical protein